MKRKGKLPLGVQNFKEIRDPQYGYLYVDKTNFAIELIDFSKYIFLSRPRRFGKSLFVDTLSEIFKGSKELFEGLYIYDKWDWTQTFPVIKIDLTDGRFDSAQSVEEYLLIVIETNAKRLNVEFKITNKHNLRALFTRFIFEIFQKFNQKVIVLIDEYDKPIIDNLQTNKNETAKEVNEILRNFYSAIKGSDAYIRFVFMTGVSKFSKMSLFSGLNNITDITITRQFGSIAGYTQYDLDTVFADYMVGLDRDEVKRWYNGYNYLGEPVYNPYDILQFFTNGNDFRNYWWQTGGAKFLIDKLKDSYPYFPELNNLVVGEETLNAFDVDHIELTALLWQTGNLTFGSTEKLLGITYYHLKIPNIEVQCTLNALFFDYLTRLGSEKTRNTQIIQAILANNFNEIEKKLRALFAAIPYQNYVKNNLANYEGYYASVVYTFLASLGFTVIAEDSTSTGRIDMTIVAPHSIVILEFKVDQPEEAALHQIKTNRYYEKYTHEGKDIYLVGIHFSSQDRNLAGMVWEKFS